MQRYKLNKIIVTTVNIIKYVKDKQLQFLNILKSTKKTLLLLYQGDEFVCVKD